MHLLTLLAAGLHKIQPRSTFLSSTYFVFSSLSPLQFAQVQARRHHPRLLSSDMSRPQEKGANSTPNKKSTHNKKARHQSKNHANDDKEKDRDYPDFSNKKNADNYNSPHRNYDQPRNIQNRNNSSRSNGSHRNSEDHNRRRHDSYENSPSRKNNYKHRNNQQSTPDHKNSGAKLPEMHFEKYWETKDISDGLKRGELIEGALRVNIRNYKESYIASPVSGERDVCIEGMEDRNRAMNGDVVVVQLNPKDKWRKERVVHDTSTTEKSSETPTKLKDDDADDDQPYYQKTGKVVYIIEKKHSRAATGFLVPYRGNSAGIALLSPTDSRVPRLMINLNECPVGFVNRPSDFAKTLFIARMTGWEENCGFATGTLMRSLGEAGELEPETEGFLLANNIDSKPFSEEVIKCLPNGDTWSITADEIKKRKDMRKECIFTIDPATAKDLDDALSCKKINEDTYEIGVHIADVSHFIDQSTALDKVAKDRATTVYLTNKAIPMLPSVLCEKLCSLNPGTDRLAYSVIWNLKTDGTIVSEWFGRTVINSCVKFSYDHAQQMIETDNYEDLELDQFPTIHHNYHINKICSIVKTLFGISQHLRSNRFESGALRLDQPKLHFSLADDTGMPNGCGVYEYKDSNRLIEEFMLLANMAVARKILKHHPKHAILRRHEAPQAPMMADIAALCDRYKIPFDISDSAAISKSLSAVRNMEHEHKDYLYSALVMMCTKPFSNAKYFCTGSFDDESAYRHYALNVPIYTHFTSPIRRYPDVMVHRCLTAALDDSFKVHGNVEELQRTAEHCNDKKWAAKRAQELSIELYFTVYVRECGPLLEKGVVVGLLSNAVDIMCIRSGITKRVYCDKLSLVKNEAKDEKGKLSMSLFWKPEARPLDREEIDKRLSELKEQFEKKWMEEKSGAASSEKVEEEENEDVPVIEQYLELFSPVDVVLSVNKQAPTKLIVSLRNPHEQLLPDIGLSNMSECED